jgi:hypothetical protein
MARKKTLTEQQLMLCRLFLAGKSKVDAYLEAGYSDQGSRKKNSIAAYERFKTASVQRYIAEFEGKVDQGVREELGIDYDEDYGDHQLADLNQAKVAEFIDDPLDDVEAELLEDTVLTRSGMLKRLEHIANQAHRLHDYEGQIKPLQEISKIMGFYRPSQVEVAAVNFQLDLAGGDQDLDADGLDPETVAMAKKVAPTMIGARSDDPEVSVFKDPQKVLVPDLDDL